MKILFELMSYIIGEGKNMQTNGNRRCLNTNTYFHGRRQTIKDRYGTKQEAISIVKTTTGCAVPHERK